MAVWGRNKWKQRARENTEKAHGAPTVHPVYGGADDIGSTTKHAPQGPMGVWPWPHTPPSCTSGARALILVLL